MGPLKINHPDGNLTGLITLLLFYITKGTFAADSLPTIEIDPPGDKIVYQYQLLTFDVLAHDPDGDHLGDITAQNLPEGARFDWIPSVLPVIPNPNSRGRFNWTPQCGPAGDYYVTFKVFEFIGGDDNFNVSVGVTKTVKITRIGSGGPCPTATPTPWLESSQAVVLPNPARDRVRFAYTVSGAAKVEIDIYRLTGERVAHIAENRDGGAGQTLTTVWDAANVAPGIYLCRVKITDSQGQVVLDQKKKVALIR